jgi:hypothetical protein
MQVCIVVQIDLPWSIGVGKNYLRRTMFNNIKNRFPYAHTKHFFLKLVAKKYENQCCTLPGRARGIMYR